MGIVNAFTRMTASGAAGGLAGISAGIAEALITTAFGLLVAIPAVWAYNYFTTKIENLTVEMTYTSKELIDYLIKSVGSEFGRSIFTKEFQAQKAVSGSGHITVAQAASQTPSSRSPTSMPMIDIMLVLLIIFMIVTPLIADGFKATMPKGKNLDKRPEGDDEVVLGIDAAGQLFPQRPPAAGRHAGGPAAVGIYAARPEDKILYFRADKELKYRQDPGSGGDRPAGRRPGHGRDHRSRANARPVRRTTRRRQK